MRTLIWLVFVMACGKGSDSSKGSTTDTPKPTPGSGSAAVATATGSGSGSAKTDKRKPDKKLTKDQIAELKKRMKAGWAKQKDNKWVEAVIEFEAALLAAPQDQRALAELGWSAMNAGDFPKARKADEQAVKVAVDKKVKASALYNLGLVQEKTGDKDGALKSYLASLALRPNKTVEQAVGRLGATPDKPPPFCAAGKKPCDCVLADAFDEMQLDQSKCEEVPSKIPSKGWKAYKVTSDAFYGSDYTYVLDEANQLVDVIDGTSERGRTMEHIKLIKADTKKAGGRTVLWIETKYEYDYMYSSFDTDDIEYEHIETTQVTLCLPGDGKTPTRCPLRDVPTHHVNEKSSDDDNKKRTTTETIVELTIADDGTATVKLVKGASDEQLAKLVGPHMLW